MDSFYPSLEAFNSVMKIFCPSIKTHTVITKAMISFQPLCKAKIKFKSKLFMNLGEKPPIKMRCNASFDQQVAPDLSKNAARFYFI